MDNGYKEEITKLLNKTEDIKFHIKRVEYDNKMATLDNDVLIGELKDDLSQVEWNLQETLTKSNEEAIKISKCGWAHFRQLKDKVIFTDLTIDEIESKYPDHSDDYIKTSRSLKLDPLKKAIENHDIILAEMSREPQEKKFEYKYTGGNK